jgi:carbonic anhydrase
MAFDEILERNLAFVAGREPVPLPPPERLGLAVVACYDPRLDPLLLPALGLKPGEAFLLRTAGALVQPGSASLRSLGLAVFMFGVTEVLIVGHAACRMASFQSSSFIEAFRGRGVPREAFGHEDLRTWAGAIPSPRQGVLLSAANIRAAPFLPRDVSVAGVVLDEPTGALEVVLRPGELPGAGTAPPEMAALLGANPEAELEAAFAGPPPEEPAPPAAAPPARPGPVPAAADPLAQSVDAFVATLRARAHWRDALRRLRVELDKPGSPLAKVRMLESFARQAGGEAQDVVEAFERVKRQATGAGRTIEAREAAELLRQLTRKL